MLCPGSLVGGLRYRKGMRDTDLFQLALGLTSPWRVMLSEFSVEAIGSICTWIFHPGAGSSVRNADAKVAGP